MKNNSIKKNKTDFIDKLINILKSHPNKKKLGELEEMIQKDDFHNKNMTEDQYQAEQNAWLEKIKMNKKTD